MGETTKLKIDVISDAVCPWCFIGQKRLEKAIGQAPDIEVEIHWRPYQLDGSIPPEGMPRREYMLRKFGSESRLKEIHANVTGIGAQEGIEFDFEAIDVSPNTLDAHRLIRWATSAGSGVQHKVARRLFELYFEEGRNIGERGVLVDVARECGMDATLVDTLLASNADTDEVRAEIDTAARMGVRGVPCFLLEGKYAVMGAQDADTLADAIRQVAAAKARGELNG
jgi:predicted DsbA family dithiol-disulfide isomerase